MTIWSKKEAIDEIDRLISDIELLKKEQALNSVRTRWMINTNQFLVDVFGFRSPYFVTFQQLTFAFRGTRVIQGWDIEALQNQLNIEGYLKDLEIAKGLLQGAKDYLRRIDIKEANYDAREERRLRCFLSHRYNIKGNAYADEIKHFLELKGVEVITGEKFEPRSVSDKIKDLLDQDFNFGVLIVTDEGESMWTRDEIGKISAGGKSVIVLVEIGATFEQGLYGDLEYISFSPEHIGDAYNKLLEGIKYIEGEISNPRR